MTGFSQTFRANNVWTALFTQIAQESNAHYVGLFSCFVGENQPVHLLAQYTGNERNASQDAHLAALLSPQLKGLREKTAYLNQKQLVGSDYVSGIVLALRDDMDRLMGVLVLLYTHSIEQQRPKGISTWVKVVHMALENAVLREERRMGNALQAVLTNYHTEHSPQGILDNLNKEHFFAEHIKSHALLFYDSQHPSRLHEYLEFQTIWTREGGFMAGPGLRIYTQSNEALFNRLESHRMVLMHVDDVLDMSDPLVRGIVNAYKYSEYILFVALKANNVSIGTLCIGSNIGFTDMEMNMFGILGDFFALNYTMANIERQRDTVERSRAELLNAVTDGVLFVVPNEVEQSGKIMTVNQSFCDMFNISTERVQNISLAELVNRMQIRKDAREVLTNEWTTIPISYPFVQTGEFETLHPDGYSVTLEWYSAPVYQLKHLIGRIYTFRDVSQSRVGARLRADFVRRLAHEMRTPLTSIQGFAELLQNSLQATPDQSDYLKLITQSAGHLNTIVSQMIEGARAESGEFELVLSPVNLLEVAQGAISLVKPTPASRNQKITISAQGNFKTIQADANLILQVCHQLLDNACKFSPSGSHIRMYITLIDSDDKRQEIIPPDAITPAILVEVADEGAGIAPDDLSLIFLPFYRSQEARAMQAPGSGLGLTIARGIIEAHRGKLWADKRRRGRKGGRFYFTLPYDA